MPSLCRLPSCIYGKAAASARSQSVDHDSVSEAPPGKEQSNWPEAPRGYPPAPPSVIAKKQQQGQQQGPSSSETGDDSSYTVESPTAPYTADSSPAPTSTVTLLEQLANTPEVLQGRSKDQQKDSAGKPPRPPPIEDTLQTSWTGRERSDRRWSGDTNETRGTDESRPSMPSRGISLLRTGSREQTLRHQNSGSGSFRRGQRIVPRLSEGDSSPMSPAVRGRESSKGSAGNGQQGKTWCKVVVKDADMSEAMQKQAMDLARQGMEELEVEKDIAGFIKKEFDKKFGPTWHCIVGQQFGSFVTYEKNCFIYFYSGQTAVMLFRAG